MTSTLCLAIRQIKVGPTSALISQGPSTRMVSPVSFLDLLPRGETYLETKHLAATALWATTSLPPLWPTRLLPPYEVDPWRFTRYGGPSVSTIPYDGPSACPALSGGHLYLLWSARQIPVRRCPLHWIPSCPQGPNCLLQTPLPLEVLTPFSKRFLAGLTLFPDAP